MSMTLAALIDSLTPVPDGAWVLSVPEEWRQGRTLYGGANAAVAAAVARASVDELGPLRSMQISFLAPADGTVTYAASLLRRGRSVSFVSVEAAGSVGPCTRAMFVFGAPRASPVAVTRDLAPAVEAPERSDAVPPGLPGVPRFLDQMEWRPAGGLAPFSGGEPDLLGWVRHREPAGLDPESALLGVADVLPPAVAGAASTSGPASSVSWALDIAALPTAPAGPFLLESRTEAAADGYSLQWMRCFDADGGLLAAGRQLCAIF